MIARVPTTNVKTCKEGIILPVLYGEEVEWTGPSEDADGCIVISSTCIMGR